LGCQEPANPVTHSRYAVPVSDIWQPFAPVSYWKART
jgi:hypothetical protein